MIRYLTFISVVTFGIYGGPFAFSQNYPVEPNRVPSSGASDSGDNGAGAAGMSALSTMHQGAKSGKKAQIIGAVANGAISAVMWKRFAASCSGGCSDWLAAAMGFSSGAQALLDITASQESGGVADVTGGGYNAGGAGNYEGGGSSPDGNYNWDGLLSEDVPPEFRDDFKTVKRGVEGFEKMGGKMDADGITLPNGKKIPKSAMNSLASMAAATGGDLEQMKTDLAKAESTIKKRVADYGARVISMQTSGGGGGSASKGRSRKPSSYSNSGIGDYLKSLHGGKGKSKKDIAAGKSLLVGGVPVGVGADNLFEMVHRKYESKRQTQFFIETSTSKKPRLRRPASLGKKSY